MSETTRTREYTYEVVETTTRRKTVTFVIPPDVWKKVGTKDDLHVLAVAYATIDPKPWEVETTSQSGNISSKTVDVTVHVAQVTE